MDHWADINKFQYLEWKHGQKLLQQPVGMMFKVAVLLYNALICLEGGEVNKYFGIAPPRLEELFHGPVPEGSDVENEWETDLEDSENEGDVN